MNKLALVFILFIYTSCKSEPNNTPEEVYNKVSNEFVSKLLELGDFSCDCIIEPTYTLLDYEEIERPEDNEDNLMLRINLTSNSEVDSLNSISRQTNLNRTIINSGYTLILRKQADSIFMLKNREEKERILDSMCPRGFMVMTKPFFNKSMDIVLIIADDMPYSCFPSLIQSYRYINGEWIIPVKM